MVDWWTSHANMIHLFCLDEDPDDDDDDNDDVDDDVDD